MSKNCSDSHSNKTYALAYLRNGFSVFPTKGKIPLIKWEKYSTGKPTETEVNEWWNKWPDANIGIATGIVSGIVVIDVDGGEVPPLPPTAVVETSPGHFQYYFIYPGFPIANSTKVIAPNCDIRGDGGFAVAPPSQHFDKDTGKPDYQYTWKITPKEAGFASIPEWVLEKIKVKKPVSDIVDGVKQGSRNVDTTSLIGSLLTKYPKSQWKEVVWPLVRAWNTQNTPPLLEDELSSIYDSITQRELSKSVSHSIYSNDLATKAIPLEVCSLTELSNKEFPENRWLVEKLIPQNGITCISGKPKVGKSILSLDLAGSIATGAQFLDEFEVQQGPVLIISKEDPPRLIQERIKSFSFIEIPIYFCTMPQIFLDSDVYIPEVKKIIKELGIKVIIIDSLRRIFKGEENSSQVISQVHNSFKSLLEEDITIVFIHHHSKDGFFKKEDTDKLRGSSDILAMLDSLLIIDKKSEDKIKIIQAALRNDKPLQPFLIQFPDFTEGNISFKFLDYTKEEKEKKEQAKEDILNLLRKGQYNQTEIITNLVRPDRYKATTVKEALKELLEIEEIACKTSGNQKIYFIPNQDSENQLSLKENGDE